MQRSFLTSAFITIVLLTGLARPCNAYSVLTHEAIVDANWQEVLLPLLREKFPNSKPDELNEARAYTYGGAVSPDMGYLPFGSKLFTNLIHYVRTGDFVTALLTDAKDLNEYAFALGVLCHYEADKYGHSLGVNLAVPVIYPKMKKKFGDTITYFQNHISHVRVEFSFDVLQTARGNYATETYHNFIGFQINRRVLDTAFFETYGLHLNDLFRNLSRTISTFRWIVRDFIPVITRAAWATQKHEIKSIRPTATSRRFIYSMHRKDYYREFSNKEEHPPFFASPLALFIRIAPKIGPLRVLRFTMPDRASEKRLVNSFDSILVDYERCIFGLRTNQMLLDNIDFDTGKNTTDGEYVLADDTYSDWLLKLQKKDFTDVNHSIRQHLLSFYASAKMKVPPHRQRDQRRWKKTLNALALLQNAG